MSANRFGEDLNDGLGFGCRDARLMAILLSGRRGTRPGPRCFLQYILLFVVDKIFLILCVINKYLLKRRKGFLPRRKAV